MRGIYGFMAFYLMGQALKGERKMYLPCIQEDVNETSDPFFQNCDFCRPPNILGN